MNQYSAYSLVSMLNGNNSANAPGYPYSNNQPPGFVNFHYNRSPHKGNFYEKKEPYFDYNNKNRPYNGWGQKVDPEVNVDEIVADHSFTVIDQYNSDLNLVIDPDGYGAYALTDPEGFCFCWAGARATYGVTRGKVFFEVHITENLPVVYGDNHQEVDPHVVRLGWSVDSCCFQLGESENSYGYGGTGKFSVSLKFSDYGERFGVGDVIGSLLDLQSHPPTISFTKNGHWFGTAYTLHNYPVGVKSKALFPHILTKNCRFKVNFGQTDAWFAPPPGFVYIDHVPLDDRVRGLTGPSKKADCEMNMIVGLPGAGKTTLGLKKQKDNPEKRYNIIGTDTLIDKMRVMGLPRKRNYHGRWEVLIDKASKCLNKLFQIAARRRRNYILDQTNVYASARKHKMKHFEGFQRFAWVLVPENEEFERRSVKRTVEDGKIVPEAAVLEMKANFKIPIDGVDPFDQIHFIELHRESASLLVDRYVKEGLAKRPPRDMVYRHDKKYQQPSMTMPPPPSQQQNLLSAQQCILQQQQQHMTASTCSSQLAQSKVTDSIAAAMAAVRAAFDKPAMVKVEPGTVKIEPGVQSNTSVSLAAPAAGVNPGQYTSSAVHTPTTTTSSATIATVIKTEPGTTTSSVAETVSTPTTTTTSAKKDDKDGKRSSNDSSQKDRKSSSRRDDSRRRERRDDRRHHSRSRSRSRSRGRSHYSERSRYDHRHRSERDRRDRYYSDRDRYRERDRDRDHHRSHYRSDSHHRRRRESDPKSRDERDSSYHSDSSSRHSDNRCSENKSQNSKEAPIPGSKPVPHPPSNFQSLQKTDDRRPPESNWQQGSIGNSGAAAVLNKDVDRRQITSPFDSVGNQDKTDLSKLFGSQDVDYRLPPSDYTAPSSQVMPTTNPNPVKQEVDKCWPNQSRLSESGPYDRSQHSGYSSCTSQQIGFPTSNLPAPSGSSNFSQPTHPGYYEGRNMNRFNNPNNYPNYQSAYPERSDYNHNRYPPPSGPQGNQAGYNERSRSNPSFNPNFPPQKDEGKNPPNPNDPSIMNQSGNRFGYPPNPERLEKQGMDSRLAYSPTVASPRLDNAEAKNLYPPYTAAKPSPSQVVSSDYRLGNDSDLRFENNVRQDSDISPLSKDNDNNARNKPFSSSLVRQQAPMSSNSNYLPEGSSVSGSYSQSASVQESGNFKQGSSYPFTNQAGSVNKGDYGSLFHWGDNNANLQAGRSSSSSFSMNVPGSVQQTQWSEGNNMNARMPLQSPMNGPSMAPGNFGMRFPTNYPSNYSAYQNMTSNGDRRYPF